MLEWLDRNLDFDDFEVTFAGNTQATVRAHPCRRAASVASSGRAAARTRRLPRAEPRRSVLECVARSACVRTAGGLPAQRRSSGARRRGRDRVRRAGGAAGGAVATRGRARATSCARFVSPRSPTSPTATSSVLRGWTTPSVPRRLALGAYVPARTASWPEASRLFVVGDDFGWSIDDDRDAAHRDGATSRLRRRSRRVGSLREEPGRLPPRPFRRAAAALARVVAPARAQLLPRTAGNRRISRVRPRLRDVDANAPRASTACRSRTRRCTSSCSRPVSMPRRCSRFRSESTSSGSRWSTESCVGSARKALGVPESAFVVGSFLKDGVGRGEGLEPKLVKGPDTLVAVLERLRSSTPELFVLLTRPGPRLRPPRGRRRLGIPHSHTVLPSRDALGSAYHAVDVCARHVATGRRAESRARVDGGRHPARHDSCRSGGRARCRR